MPAIRDVTSTYATATTGLTLVIPVPAVAENDLLVATLIADTGTATSTWTAAAGWSQLFRRLNTVQHDVWYKIAGASESGDYTFTRSAGESLNGRVISISDINTTSPFGVNTGAITVNVVAAAATFTRTSGSFTTDGFANGDTIVTAGFTNGGNNTTKIISTITGSGTIITVTSGTGLVNESGDGNETVKSFVWTDTTQAAAAKYTLPQITTTVANSLILYAVANSSTGVPSIIEGPVSIIAGEDGTAEAGGEAWTFQPSKGATPNNVYCSNVFTGAGVVSTIQIAPPSSGATVIPAYCAADLSIYVDPLNGTTAYNGNAAFAATFDTLMGTALGSVTLADGAVTSITDVGLNSFHSVTQLTSISASKNWGGAALDLAAGNDVNASGKNVLVHLGPNTPGQIQRFGPAASQKGIALAMLSTAGNWKAWHVHGKGTAFGTARDVPLIINSSNTTGVIQTTGTLDATAVDVFGFAVSGNGVLTTSWQFYSLWVLDTVTICGGIAADPIDIPGTVLASAVGHERKSVIQQGANQAIFYQPIQFGNGGTNPTYLDFNATAIEFPRQYDLTKLQVNYCSADNVVGITYYAGPSDTIKHRNSIISSPSRYHWKLHASSSTSATYDFSGLSVIGAGTISLARAITITGVTINDCSTLDASSLTLNSSTISSPPATSDSITVNSSSTFSSCNINVSTVTAGNYWVSTATPDKFSSCTFTGGGGHAIRITATGTFNLVGNTFTSFGATGSTGAAIYNDSSGAVTLNISGGVASPTYKNGTSASTTINNNVNVTVTVKDSAGTAIPGVEVAIFQDNTARTVVLASTATDGSGQVTTTAANGLGAIIIRARQSTNKATFATSQAFTSEVLTTDANHNFRDGDPVVYSKNGGTASVGLTAGTTYYVNNITTNTLSLHTTAANAIADTSRIDLSTNGSETHVLDPIRCVAASATGTIATSDFSAQITMITDSIATG